MTLSQADNNSPASPPIRAIFLDIDGTLISVHETVSERVLHAIREAQSRGVEVVLCTGRTRFRIAPIAPQMPGSAGYAVCSNGGTAVHLGTGEVLYRRLMPAQFALPIIQAIVEAGSEPYVFEDSEVPGIEGARVLFHPELPVGAWADFPRYRPHQDILSDLPFDPISVSAFGMPEIMRPLAHRLRVQFGDKVAINESGSGKAWGVEIYTSGVSKQLGAEVISARLGIRREEVMAIGDHINDIEMIRWAGVGVAMGNALEETQAAADWLTGSVAEDGVAMAIERFVTRRIP